MTAESRKTRRDQLIAEYQEYVHHVVGRLIQMMGLPADLFDEFVSAGYLGLVEAAERFDGEVGSDFKPFAFLRIRGAVIDSIRRNADLSGRAYRYSRVLAAAQNLREEFAAHEEITGTSAEGLRDRLCGILDFAAKGALSYRMTMHDAEQEVADNQEKPSDLESLFQNDEHRQRIRKLTETLPEKERLIIEEYYFHDKSFSEITAQYPELSASWVSRLHSRGLASLQRALQRQDLDDAEEVNDPVGAARRRAVAARLSRANRARLDRERRKSATHKTPRRSNRGKQRKTARRSVRPDGRAGRGRSGPQVP